MQDQDPSERSRFAEILTVAGAEAVDMILSVRLFFLMAVYGGVGILTGYMWRMTDANSEGQLREFSEKAATLSPDERAENLERMAEEGGPFLEWLGSLIFDPQLPLLAMLILQVSGWVLPLLILFVGYNRVADDLQSRYTLYIFQRIHRDSYLVGKVLGHAAVCFAAVIVMQVVWLGLANVYEFYGAENMGAAVPRLWLGMVAYVLAYSAYTMFVSAAFGRPVVALMLGTLFMYAGWIGAYLLSFLWPPLLGVWLSSWYAPLWQMEPAAYGVFLAYAVGFMTLAGLIFRRIDL